MATGTSNVLRGGAVGSLMGRPARRSILHGIGEEAQRLLNEAEGNKPLPDGRGGLRQSPKRRGGTSHACAASDQQIVDDRERSSAQCLPWNVSGIDGIYLALPCGRGRSFSGSLVCHGDKVSGVPLGRA